jgi:hypothetical protein
MGTNPDLTGRAARLFLIGVGLTMAVAALVFIVSPPEIASGPVTSDAHALAERMARHPTDWAAASALSEVALDMRSASRFAVWRETYEHASLLAPERPDPASGFARAGFFHWTELSPDDQRAVLTAYAPLLRNPSLFARMARPLFELTGSLSMLRRSHPDNSLSTGLLMALAAQNGFFADYRELRAEWQRRRVDEFNAFSRTATPDELMARFPDPPYHADAEPSIVALLQELHRHPIEDNPNRPNVIDAVVDYALRHDLSPLDGLQGIAAKPGAASAGTRLRLARMLGLDDMAREIATSSNVVQRNESEWQGLCEKDVCYRAWRNIDASHGVALTIETVQTDNVAAYVEIYLDDALRAEGEVGPKRDFIVPTGNPGPHRVEVVLANPLTRNGIARRVHIAGITTL